MVKRDDQIPYFKLQLAKSNGQIKPELEILIAENEPING